MAVVTDGKSPFADSEELCDVDKLLVLVQNHPAIYNLTLKEHHNQDLLTKIWATIAKELNVPVHVCKNKWANLRNGYNRYVRELKKTPSGSGQKKKKWHLFDAMQFLQPFTGSTRKMSSNLTSPPLEDARATADIVPVDTTTSSEIQTEQIEINEEGEITINENVEFVPAKKKPKTAAEIVAAPMVDYLKVATEKKKQVDSLPENAMLSFFKSLIPDTDLLTTENKRKFKLNVMSSLDNLIERQNRNLTPTSAHDSFTSNRGGTSSEVSTYHELRPLQPRGDLNTFDFPPYDE